MLDKVQTHTPNPSSICTTIKPMHVSCYFMHT